MKRWFALKRKIALLLSVLMLVVCMMPFQVFAEEDKGLETAIKFVKSKITVPDEYTEFNYNILNYKNKRTWDLSWNSKDGEGSINVRVDEKGNIIDYSSYKPRTRPDSNKLPKFSRQQAKENAEAFIKNLNPELLGQLKYMDNDVASIRDYEYYFSYARIVNGVPYYANTVYVSVNPETGEVRNYNYNWDEDLKFPAADGAISMEKAKQAFVEKLGLELKYHYTYTNDSIKPFAAFVQKYENGTYIDALTGEKLKIDPWIGIYYDGVAKDEAKVQMSSANVAGGASIVLTEEELKAVEKVSKLISKEDAEKKARELKVLELTGDYKATRVNLSRSWPEREKFEWRIEFTKDNKRYVSVSIDAASGEVKSFNTYYEQKDGETAKYDENAAKAAAEALLKELQPEKFQESFYDESSTYPRPYVSSEKPTNYTFTYTRKVNGIPFQGNALTVGYDAVNGKITSFGTQWFDIELPPVDHAVSIDKVYEKLFNEIGLELQYVNEAKLKAGSEMIYIPENVEYEVKLVYAVKSGKPVIFDVNTGNIINYNGDLYKETRPVEYSDISGHYAENQIKVLAEYGISLEGTEFNPDKGITQQEFLTLLSKTLNYYGPYSSEKEVDSLYAFFLREGILKAEEKAPQAVVTRQDAVKFIIRALKYDKVADIKGIYNCEFKDVESIAPELVGYVTIAKGLGIINGYDGLFKPADEITRAQAAVVIYNYLQR